MDLILQVRKKISEIDSTPQDLRYEDNSIFTQDMDSQLVHWLNRQPDEWVLSWGGKTRFSYDLLT